MSAELHDHDQGLNFDMSTLLERRRLLRLFAGAGLAALVAGCGSSGSSSDTTTDTTPTSATTASTTGSTSSISTASSSTSGATSGMASTTTAASSAAESDLTVIPEETAGPYPGDGSNGVNVLTESGIVRSDITASFGSSTTVAEGIPTTIKLRVLDAGGGTPLSGAAVYLWHCTMGGEYSLYSRAITNENYLRGVQAADADGIVTFTTIYPGCYAGRWPHIHFEVYPSVDDATSSSSILATSQLALPAASNTAVYATAGYEDSIGNYARTSMATDNVFSDGAGAETPTVTGSVEAGLVLSLDVPVAA